MTQTREALEPSTPAVPPHVMRTVWVLVIGAFAAILDSTIVAIAINDLADAFDAPVATIQWASTAYLLALAVVIPLVGWGQNRIGGKRLWLIALSLFLAGSVLCALAWDAQSLIAFRAVQGLGGGILFPLMQSLAVKAAGGRTEGMGRLMALVSVPVALGPILGPVIGGVILSDLTWHWLFLVNVPIVAVGILLAVLYLPKDAAPARRERLDVVGLLLLAPGLALLLLGLTNVEGDGMSSPEVLVPGIIGIALTAAFTAWSLVRRDRALVRVRLLGRRRLGSATLVLALFGAAMYGAMILLPLYWQDLRGASVLTAALLLIPQGVGSLLARPVAAALIPRWGDRAVAALGLALVVVGTAPFAFADATTSDWWLGAVLLVRGFGLGTVLIPLMTASMIGLPAEDVPQASMLTRIAQQVGGAFGTAVLAVVLTSALGAATSADAAASAFHAAFAVATGLSVVALAACALLPGRVRPAA